MRIVNKVKTLRMKKDFRNNIKWIRANIFESCKYKDSYDEDVPFKTVNILKYKDYMHTEITVERLNEKIENIFYIYFSFVYI